MARYQHRDRAPRFESPSPERAPYYENGFAERENSHAPHNSISTIAPAFAGARGYDLREPDTTRGALIRSERESRTVIEEPVIEHEHHHLHHHIDHGNVSSTLSMARPARPGIGREYSYDDLDVRERRYPNGVTVSTIRENHGVETRERRHRHRHRHRSGRSVDRSERFSRSEYDLSSERYGRSRRGSVYDEETEEEYTVVDVPAGSKRVEVKVKTEERERDSIIRERAEREREITWRRENGVRRSRGLGNELWTEITKDMVTREAIEELGYAFEETDFFYYIFEYLDRDQIAELVDLSMDIRKRRVRDIEYESIASEGRRRTPRMMLGGRPAEFEEDTRTEIIVESTRGSDRRSRRNRYYNY